MAHGNVELSRGCSFATNSTRFYKKLLALAEAQHDLMVAELVGAAAEQTAAVIVDETRHLLEAGGIISQDARRSE